MSVRPFSFLPLLAALFVTTTGCERPAQPAQQHAELRRLSSGSRPTPKVVDGARLRFDGLGVSVVGPNNATLGAGANWQVTESPAKLQQWLKSKATKARPDLGEGKATSVVLRATYFDENDKPTGSDDVEILLADTTDKGNGRFPTLGTDGRVARIDVEVTTIVWQSGDKATSVTIKGEGAPK
jgi:hypothetical protein